MQYACLNKLCCNQFYNYVNLEIGDYQNSVSCTGNKHKYKVRTFVARKYLMIFIRMWYNQIFICLDNRLQRPRDKRERISPRQRVDNEGPIKTFLNRLTVLDVCTSICIIFLWIQSGTASWWNFTAPQQHCSEIS